MNYIKIYNKIIEHRLSNIPENCYTEKHHIVPNCLDGINNPDNLVKVTPKEHYILHHLLTKIYPDNNGISRAFKMLRNRLNISRNSNPYSCIRKCEYSSENIPMYGKTHSEETKLKMSLSLTGKKSPMFGKTHSEETKLKMSESHIGKTLSEETKLKLSLAKQGENNPFFGKTLSKEHKQKLSLIQKGKTHSEETKLKISNSRSGKIIVNNGVIAKLVYPDNIPEGFVKGRLRKCS